MPSSPGPRPGPPYAEVAVAVPVDRTFTYAIPEDLRPDAVPGRRVRVPFGHRTADGYLVALRDTLPEGVSAARVKPLRGLLDEDPLLAPALLDLGRFVSGWYGASLGEALDAALPAAVKSGGKRRRIPTAELVLSPDETRAAADALPDAHAKRARMLHALLENDGRLPVRELRRVTHASDSPVRTLERDGLIRIIQVEATPDPFALRRPVEPDTPPDPTPEQSAALETVGAAVDARAFGVFLLLGITGSGKTEVYLRTLERVVAAGRQAVVLVPEIALTPQTVRRFRARFPRVAVLHSALTDAERHRQWKRIRAGEADVVIGPRSAVYAPVPDLGLLVIDEEHETSFKQQSVPRYHARDVGIVRARDAGAVVLLGSATPSLETWSNAQAGKYTLLRLPNRVGGGRLPKVDVVDMTRERAETKRPLFISRRLDDLLTRAFARGEQGLLFLNRRGYANVVSCGRCGFVMECEGCSLPFTFHRRLGMGLCHYCGGERRVADDCPDCEAPGLKRRGFGTEKVEESLRTHFPDVRIARMDSDTMKGRDAYEKVLDAFRRRELDLLVGTQMIAKGLDFPDVTVVGVLNADLSLFHPDFRAAERTFQLLAQVAGRAGRAEKPGRVVVQTTHPDHPAVVLAAQHDFETFARAEVEERRLLGYPPHARLLRVVTSAEDPAAARDLAAEVAKTIRARATKARVLGPAPAPLEMLKGRTRWHVLVKAPDARVLATLVATVRALRGAPRRGGADMVIDVDPMGTA